MGKIHQTFRIGEKYIRHAKEVAEKENRALSNVYETAVIEFLQNRVKNFRTALHDVALNAIKAKKK